VLATVDHLLGRLEWAIAGLCMVVIVVSMAMGVLFRDLLDAPLAWTNDLGVLALLWLTFIGASALYKEQGHIAVDAFSHHLPPAIRRGLGAALILLMGVTIAVTGWEMLALVKLQNTKQIPSLGLSRSFNGIPVVWMAASMAFSSLRQLLAPEPAQGSAGVEV
jgi:TRAP-type C4-dicarboxylate transport system permease small subunit